MKYFCLLFVAALVGICVYAYHHNPDGCAKLTTDLRADFPTIASDVTTIFTKIPEAPDESTAPPAAAASAQPAALSPADQEASRQLAASSAAVKANFNNALAEAGRSQKKVLLHFTGAWCPMCKVLDEEVLSTQEWRSMADRDFITVTLSLRKEIPGTDADKTASELLADQYNVHGCPVLIVADADGKELMRLTGAHPGGGPSEVIQFFKPYSD